MFFMSNLTDKDRSRLHQILYGELCHADLMDQYETMAELRIAADIKKDPDARFLMSCIYLVMGVMSLYDQWHDIDVQDGFNSLRKILNLQKRKGLCFGHAVGMYIARNKKRGTH